MRIVFLITVGAFLFSIAIAQGEVPVGQHHHQQHQPYHQYHQYHHPKRLPSPIVLEPVPKFKPESGPFDWLINMVSRVVNPPKKPPPAMIGPINLPGMAGQVYIRQLDNGSPWESNHVVIKMVTRDPVTGMNVPLGADQSYHRGENLLRKMPKPYGFQSNDPPGRSNNMIHQGFQASPTAHQYSKWQPYNQPGGNHQYSNSYAKPFRAPTSNDFRQDDHPKSHRESYDSGSLSSYNLHNDNYQSFQPASTVPYRDSGVTTSSPIYLPTTHPPANHPAYGNDYADQRYMAADFRHPSDDVYSREPDSLRTTRVPYGEYSLRGNIGNRGEIINTTSPYENTPSNKFSPAAVVRGQVVRTDRMVSNNRNRGQFVLREETHFRGGSHSQGSQRFRHGPMTKFQLEDVGGIEVIDAPKLKPEWGREIGLDQHKTDGGKSRDSGYNDDEDSISIGNGKNLARGESAEHSNDDQAESQTSKVLQSRLSTYKVIDRSHRSQGSQNTSSSYFRQDSQLANRMGDKENPSIEKKVSSREEKTREQPSGISNATVEVSEQKMANSTAGNRWRFQERRKPTRVVKAIYRRKPLSESVKNNNGSKTSDRSNEQADSDDEASPGV